MKGKDDVKTAYMNGSINRYRFGQHKSMSTEGTHRHENWEGFREKDVMKEKAVVKDWDNNHLEEMCLVEKGVGVCFLSWEKSLNCSY